MINAQGMKKNGSDSGARDRNGKISISKRAAFLKQTALFSTFDRAHLEDIAWVISERRVMDGEWLCRAGDPGDEIFVVHEGTVEVVVEKDGQEEVVYAARPGDVLGEIAVLGRIPRTAALRARGRGRLFVIPGPRFIQLLRENADMSLAVIEMLVRRLTG